MVFLSTCKHYQTLWVIDETKPRNKHKQMEIRVVAKTAAIKCQLNDCPKSDRGTEGAREYRH